MASIYKNDKGFHVFAVTGIEMASVFHSPGICDSCNKAVSEGFLVCVLNYYQCKSCFEEFLGRSHRYTQDIPVEEQIFENYKRVFIKNNILEDDGPTDRSSETT